MVDVSSHDQRGGSHDVEACVRLSSEQCAVMVGSETERQLSSAVGRWCEWGGEEGDGGEEIGKVFRCLHLTAELCCVARKVGSLAGCPLSVVMSHSLPLAAASAGLHHAGGPGESLPAVPRPLPHCFLPNCTGCLLPAGGS